MFLAAFLILALAASALLTYAWLKLAIRNGWYDVPNQRSSHRVPTPKSGGAGFVVCFLACAVLLFHTGELLRDELFILLLGALPALLGFFDDVRNLPIATRLPAQFVVALTAVWLLQPLPILPLPVGALSAAWLIAVLVVVCLVWLINLYNFMDGIDGLAAMEAIFIALALSWLSALGGAYGISLAAMLLAVAVAGFVYFNLPVARVFMGDLGSNFLGYTLGVLGLLAVQHDAITIWTLAILLAGFAVDSTVTLVRRMASGAVWYHGHRTHAYQLAAMRYRSHGKVVTVFTVTNLFWLLPMAWMSTEFRQAGLFLFLLSSLPLLAAVLWFQALEARDSQATRYTRTE